MCIRDRLVTEAHVRPPLPDCFCRYCPSVPALLILSPPSDACVNAIYPLISSVDDVKAVPATTLGLAAVVDNVPSF